MQEIKKLKWYQYLNKYRYIILAILGVLVIGATLIVYGVQSQKSKIDDTPSGEVDVKPIVFASPLANLEVITDFSNRTLKYNKTLKIWESHKSIDFKATEGETVFAAFDGKVLSIEKTYARGTIITIEHSGGLKTIYSSLSDNVKVAVNDTISKGQAIGTASNTAANFKKDGTMLKFEVMKDGKLVSPYDYLVVSEK